ncbi:MAG: SDR family oxidoreductase [Clostridia bacterium]|nr:SDR family oxidoreductase [Clostridia bacterium]
MEVSFRGKNIVVTGAGNGIGKEISIMFARAGGAVYALDKAETSLALLRREAEAEGLRIRTACLDVVQEEAVAGCFRMIRDEMKTIDTLVNSAGIISFVKMDGLNADMWDQVLNVNLRGSFFCSREAAAIMKKQGSGSIVNITAGAAKTGGMNPSAAYVSSKGGLNSMTLHLAVQLHPYGIRVNAICPGPIDTQMIDAQANLPGAKGSGKDSIIAAVPLGLGKPEDIAYGALFLASDQWARYITGEILDINGGLVMD